MYRDEYISISDWLLFFVLMAIPGLNIFIMGMLLIDSKTNQSIKNLIWSLIIIIGLIFFGYLTLLVVTSG